MVNFVCEIPMGVTAKLEVQKKLPNNPIMQDTKKGALRCAPPPRHSHRPPPTKRWPQEVLARLPALPLSRARSGACAGADYTYGSPFFNYGMLPQTWEDPAKKGFNGTLGDNDPLDVMEIGSRPFKMGEMRPVKILGDLELIDQGELDHKIIVIDAADPMAAKLSSASDLKTVMPGVLEKLIEWLKMYKTTDGKAINVLASDTPKTAAEAAAVVSECHASWTALKARGPGATGFWLG